VGFGAFSAPPWAVTAAILAPVECCTGTGLNRRFKAVEDLSQGSSSASAGRFPPARNIV